VAPRLLTELRGELSRGSLLPAAKESSAFSEGSCKEGKGIRDSDYKPLEGKGVCSG